MIDLSVIILSYNTREITLKCVDQAILAATKNTEIIVVDNGSTDGSVEELEKIKKIKFVNAQKNLGFAGGNNLALSQAQGRYLLLLNSDAYVEKETFKKTIEYFDKHDGVDVFGCQLKYANGRVQPSAGFLPIPRNIVLWVWGIDRLLGMNTVHPVNKEFFAKTRKVDWVMGAFLAIRRKVWQETGGMDEHFFMYMEEVEWCWRMKQKGFSVWYVPEWQITHLDKASSKGDIRGPLVKEMIGLSYLVQRHMPNAWWWLRPVLQLGNSMRMVGWLVMGKPQMAAAYKEILKKI